MTALIQIISAVLGTAGFSMLFNIDKKHILKTSIGGGICWTAYLLFVYIGCGVFAATFLASCLAGIYGEILAHVCKVPTTVFFIPVCIPLIPGSNLYYAMVGLLSTDMESFRRNAILLGLYAFGIAVGLSIIVELEYIRNALAKRRRA